MDEKEDKLDICKPLYTKKVSLRRKTAPRGWIG
jgi:hypothetical protein